MMRIAIALVAITLAGVSGYLLRDFLQREPGQRPGSAGSERPQADPSVPALDASRQAQVAELRQMLEWEIGLREELAAEVEQLKQALQSLETGLPTTEAEPSAAPASPHGMGARLSQEQEFDTAVLDAAGFSPSEIEDLQTRSEDMEMERLYLRDRAAREGWLRTPRYVEELGKITSGFDSLREEFGDERYDWLLYASGRSNRVAVVGVFGRSPAAEAGIRSGDRILSYDSRRIFDAEALRRATTEGRPGEMLPIDIERNGESLRLYIPRGPLGVRLSPERRTPTAR